ncbi:glycosyltransferase family 4 protein [Sneathiella sp. CAU 1612]|uniref:Glycosyltransferase family 4 protein n=1 Tax=Sneathiella sedimenti TaxID=2816034 RepID=A0ABS3F379_9PROT|nr:glycosyltransferase family 4 protein [Sneathiella sedimenti]MBO0332976.1 glycosyltransferase family 4 protein [Sneathiella sedimenti]
MNEIELEHSTPSPEGERRHPTVLQILPGLNGGGVERGTIEMASALKESGGMPIVVSSGGIMTQELKRIGVRHITLPVDSKNPFVMRRNVVRLAAIVREFNVDILHARSRAPAWSAYFAARKTGAHFLTTFHAAYTRGGFFKNAYNSIMTKGERVIAISDFIADHILKNYDIAPEKVVTIPRGVDCRKFNPAAIHAERIIDMARSWDLPDGVPVIMLPGRLTRLKGHTTFINALAQIKDRDFLALLVGSTEGREAYCNELNSLVKSHGLEGRVQIKGHCEDMAVALMLSDVVVSATTVPEGFGRIAVEAQAMGRPVIATAHGGSMETIIDGETGWLIPVGDVDAMAAALAAAIDLSSEEREAVAIQAREHVMTHFAVEHMCNATIALYNDILGR